MLREISPCTGQTQLIPYLWQLHDKVMGVGLAGGCLYLFLCDTIPAIADVLLNGGGKEHRLLTDDPNVLTEPGHV